MVHYRIHKCLSTVPILNQPDSVRTPTSYFVNIRLNILLPSMLWSSKWSLYLMFPNQNPVYVSPLLHTRYMPRPHLTLLDFITRIILGEGYRSLIIVFQSRNKR